MKLKTGKMAPYELKAMTVKQLGDTIKAMSEPEYLWGVSKLSPEKQRENAWQNQQLQMANLQMRNAQLSDIRDKLIANETDLSDGILRVQKVVEDLTKTEEVMSQVKNFLDIVGRIVPLLA